MSSPAASRRKGAKAEIEVLAALIAAGHDAARIRLTGSEDQGDIVVFRGASRVHVYEVKDAKAQSIPGWLRELDREVENTRKARPGCDVTGSLLVRHRGGIWSEVKRWQP